MSTGAVVLIILLAIIVVAGLPQFKLHEFGDKPSGIAAILLVILIVLLIVSHGQLPVR